MLRLKIWGTVSIVRWQNDTGLLQGFPITDAEEARGRILAPGTCGFLTVLEARLSLDKADGNIKLSEFGQTTGSFYGTTAQFHLTCGA